MTNKLSLLTYGTFRKQIQESRIKQKKLMIILQMEKLDIRGIPPSHNRTTVSELCNQRVKCSADNKLVLFST